MVNGEPSKDRQSEPYLCEIEAAAERFWGKEKRLH